MEEIFKDIPGYEWLYQASNLGSIKSLKWWRRNTWKEKILNKYKDTKWYLFVILFNNWNKKHRLIHRLICITFLGNNEDKEVNHKNWIKDDNNLNNLEWMTRSENQKHSHRFIWNKTHFQTNNPSKWKFWILNPKSKKVNQYDRQWNFIKTWDCIKDVKRKLWISSASIYRCNKWIDKTAWWFIWKYFEYK